MVFVDGENLAIRYASTMNGLEIPGHVTFERDVYVWSDVLREASHHNQEVVRTYYYTSVVGSVDKLAEIEKQLEAVGIEAPRVFKKKKDQRSKAVDITLAVDMLTHAYRKNYDAAVLVSGDGDYVPVIEAAIREGVRVFVWSLSDGRSDELARVADFSVDLTPILSKDEEQGAWAAAFHQERVQ